MAILVALDCGSPPVDPNGVITSWQPSGSIYYNTSLIYDCHYGYWYSYDTYEASLVCDDVGDWNPTNLQCTGKFYLGHSFEFSR